MDAWQDPVVEKNNNNMVIFSHSHQMQMTCQHLQLQNNNCHHTLRVSRSVLHLVSMLEIIDRVTVLEASSHVQIRIAAHTMNRQTRLAFTTNQDLLLVMETANQCRCARSVVLLRDVDMPSGEFDVGADEENPNFQFVPDQHLEENPSVEPPLQSPQPSEPPLPPPRRRITTQQFERNVRARQSNSSVPPVPSSEAALPFSACSSEPACRRNNGKLGVEVSYLVTAEMFENPEDDWLAIAASSGVVLVSR